MLGSALVRARTLLTPSELDKLKLADLRPDSFVKAKGDSGPSVVDYDTKLLNYLKTGHEVKARPLSTSGRARGRGRG